MPGTDPLVAFFNVPVELSGPIRRRDSDDRAKHPRPMIQAPSLPAA